MTLRPRAAASRRSAARARRALADMLTLKSTEGNEEARVKRAGYALIELWPPGGPGGAQGRARGPAKPQKCTFCAFWCLCAPRAWGLAPHLGGQRRVAARTESR